MVDYNALKKKFPTKNPQKKKKVAAIKAIKRERANRGSGVVADIGVNDKSNLKENQT